MKKWLSLLLCCLLIGGAAAAQEHVHTPLTEWNRDAQNHWHDCACGEKLEAGPHAIQDAYCLECESEIWLFEDGSADVYNSNQYGDMVRYTAYDAQGTVLDEYTFAYTYTAEGAMTSLQAYCMGALVEEIQCTVNEDGFSIPSIQTLYSEGSTSVNEYDSFGYLLRAVVYDAQETMIMEETYEYLLDENNEIIQTQMMGRYAGGASSLSITNAYGDQISSVWYDADGNVSVTFTSEFGYDELGNKLWQKNWIDGVLNSESVYAAVEDEYGVWPYEQMNTEYLEDGGKVVREYDENGETLSTVTYDAEGKQIP